MHPDLFANMASVEETHWWFVARRRIVVGMARTLGLPEDADILDLGAGTGGTTRHFRDFAKVTAIEIDPEARRFLPADLFEEVRDRPLPDASIPSESFDLVTAFDVMEHIEGDVEVFSDIRRLLRPSGHMLLTVPAGERFWSAHDELHHHVRRYSKHSLREAASQAGMDVVFCGYWLTTLFPVFVVDRLIPNLLNRPAGGVSIPPTAINRFLAFVVGFEASWLSRRVSAPFGASLVCILRPSGSGTTAA